jgi:hypothetical protein
MSDLLIWASPTKDVAALFAEKYADGMSWAEIAKQNDINIKTLRFKVSEYTAPLEEVEKFRRNYAKKKLLENKRKSLK